MNFVREMVNTPSNTLTPSVLAEKAQAIASELPGLSCTVFDRNKIEELGMNGILTVAKGSIYEPKFIILEYDGAQGKQGRPIVVVGKGVTFDTGGISLKPCNGMEKMKYDMGGAGAVIGFMKSAAELKLPYHLVGIIPTVENMPSASAYKPGDVITMASGKT
ncbi:M17 family metallopeptidase, partial [Arthrospira platensis SPKY1]|nr:M17 family metallopeptidase [Arthrospira platensis SPKY1]